MATGGRGLRGSLEAEERGLQGVHLCTLSSSMPRVA